MGSTEVKAAWISGITGAVGVIIAAVVTGGFGLAHPGPPSPSPSPPSSSPSPSPSPLSPSLSPLRNAAAVPPSYQGTWTGLVTQADTPSYSLTLQIGTGNIGNAVGSWQIPLFGCSGELYLESGGGPLEMRQVTTFNPGLKCYVQFEIAVSLHGDNLGYVIKAITMTSGQFVNGNPVIGDATLAPQ